MQILKIGQVAAEAGVGVDTVRYYERAGLMPKAPRTQSGYRNYRAADVQRLKFIRRARGLGFTVDQIGALLQLSDGEVTAGPARSLAQQRLEDLDQKIRELTTLRTSLAGFLDASPAATARGALVETLLKTPERRSGSAKAATPKAPSPARRRR